MTKQVVQPGQFEAALDVLEDFVTGGPVAYVAVRGAITEVMRSHLWETKRVNDLYGVVEQLERLGEVSIPLARVREIMKKQVGA